MANNPELLKMPLARDGQKSTIPETTDASTGLFSQQYGWQSINSLPPQAGGKAVKREDFNGAFNLLGGIAYYAQKGFTFKWSADQDYYAGCVVIDDTDGLRYECIADVTANNTAPSADATHWQVFSAGTDMDAWFRQADTGYAVGDMRCYESLPYGWYLECTTAGITGSGDITIPSPLDVGDTVTDGKVVWTIRKIGSGGDGVPLGAIIAYSANGELPSGYLLCDGSAVSRSMFPDLFSAIGTTYGAGDGSTTFNLPNYADGKFPEGSTVAGTVKQPGLPNIEGEYHQHYAILWGGTTGNVSEANGALSVSGAKNASNASPGSGIFPNKLTFDASLSNPIYGASNTVQPPALTARFIIKAYDGVTPTPAEADISEMLTELTGKADRRLSNLDTANLACHVVVDSYYDDTTGDWWREYDDGWIEQGGVSVGTGSGSKTITFLKPFADTNYYINNVGTTAGGAWDNVGATPYAWALSYCGGVDSLTTTSFVITNRSRNVWHACGMGAQS